jgi:hypothetical protein
MIPSVNSDKYMISKGVFQNIFQEVEEQFNVILSKRITHFKKSYKMNKGEKILLDFFYFIFYLCVYSV